MKKLIYTIPATAFRDRKKRTVEAEQLAPGLVLHEDVEGFGLWRIVHQRTGKVIASAISKAAARRLALKWIATGLDFTKSARDIAKDAKGKKLPLRD